MARRPLALAHLTIADATPAQFVDAAAGAGFAAVGLRITGFTPDDDGVGIVGNARAIDDLARRLAGEGLSTTAVCTYRLQNGRRPEDYLPVFEACRDIGADTVLLTCFLDNMERAVELVAGLARHAAGFGVRLGLEMIPVSGLKTLKQAEELRRRIREPNVGHIIDALHLHRAGESAIDVAALDPTVIYGIQFCDAPAMRPSQELLRQEVRERLYPGDGGLPLDALLKLCDAASPVELEMPIAGQGGLTVSARAASAYAAGRRFLESMDRP
ncbi:TIM barrel protein [Corticibacterium sp. UT-5YL-CI-8]|nr:TIM barrel protein [Tianweitania sp. UT-5YL-CI-8]